MKSSWPLAVVKKQKQAREIFFDRILLVPSYNHVCMIAMIIDKGMQVVF